MSTFLSVLLAIIAFGLLIFIHELGHFVAARLCHVTVNEFSIGMGPQLVSYRAKKSGILYSLRMLPLGGFVSMAGEDEISDDPNSFDKKPAWQRLIITAAGPLVNIIAGILAMVIVVAASNIGSTVVHSTMDKDTFLGYYPEEEYQTEYYDNELRSGDRIVSIDGKRVSIADELSYEIMRRGYEPVDVVIIRDGEELTLHDVRFPVVHMDGQSFGMMNMYVYRVEKTFFGTIGISLEKSWLTVRSCWESIFDLISGRYTLSAVSGPVGIASAMGDAAQEDSIVPFLSIVVIISINLGLMNLIPFPALDGGRLLLLIVELVTRKKLPAKAEGIINMVGLFVLLSLSVLIMIKDIIGLF